MSINYNQILSVAVLLHSAVLATVAFSLLTSKDRRTKGLWKLAILEIIIFPIAVVLASYLQPTNTMLAALSNIVYSLVGAFVVSIEIPGFLLLSTFDGTVVDALEKCRTELVTMGYSFSHLAQLKAIYSANEQALRSTGLYSLIGDFIAACDHMKNLDKTSWGLTLSEVSRSATFFSERSKHPFPKLIEILSLAGLSFLLAQFLKLFG
jgi:hypothetical protein